MVGRFKDERVTKPDSANTTIFEILIIGELYQSEGLHGHRAIKLKLDQYQR